MTTQNQLREGYDELGSTTTWRGRPSLRYVGIEAYEFKVLGIRVFQFAYLGFSGYCQWPLYDDCLFSIQMHHGGRLIHKYYLNGTVTYFDYVDKDKMSLTEIDCMAMYWGHIGRIDYWYRVEDEGDLKGVEFDSEVIEMCENVSEVRMINMYMDHRDNLDDVLNSHTDSNLPELDKAIVLHDGLDEATSNEAHRTRKLTLSMNSTTAKGKENVAAIDEGCVQHEPNKGNSNGKEKVAKVDEGKIETKRKQKLQHHLQHIQAIQLE
ncbi:unnamed protein product [Prunus armeniaca]|uniref:PB1-like domain-containing protein n=1 Tax=Prunus armeniaca TaxID=36596 RepID=A0A6J5YCD9_PRUAR|nr:unnamed protein product [Prunus armeniaca]